MAQEDPAVAEEGETMKIPRVSKLVPRHPDGRVSTEAVGLTVLTVTMTVLTVVVVLDTPHPNLWGFCSFLVFLMLGMSLLSLVDRVIKLERVQKEQTEALQAALEQAKALQQAAAARAQPGTLEFMIHDAKAASRAAGYSLAKQEEVAQTVLTSCLRKGGTFEA
jgi:hypothetical protein